MSRSQESRIRRRTFLRTAGSVAAVSRLAHSAPRSVAIVADPADPVASAKPAQWAIQELAATLVQRGVTVQRSSRLADTPPAALCVLASGADAGAAAQLLKTARLTMAAGPESLALASGPLSGRTVVLACGHDTRGLVYALTELADRASHAQDVTTALASVTPVAEQPANRVRAISRLFTSDVEDKSWYNDRAMWPAYLSMLATQRFNRFQLSLGIGYDFLREVTDAYFLFPYPFLLPVPGYNVRVPQLSDAERDRNLAMLQYISEQTVLRGLDFQLGLWMHGYEWINSPNPNYTIAGLTHETHGPYCRDAVRALLRACPAITGITFRVHGESGVEEGSYNFWKSVFEGVSTCGRKVEIDMHAKGMDQTMIDLAVASGMPVKISPKYWAEHMGITYHQADIRELERPRPGRQTSALMKFSAGSRSFLRYGYGDLLREDRRWGVLHRIWPGTQRLLLWGDPQTAAAHSRALSFCGSDGVDIMEPLSFKGRRGSGLAGGRNAYADATLRPRWDWQKYLYTYRVWGRLLYNPEADPDVWRRSLHHQFGAAAGDLETSLANASRILPLVTTAHGASAANNSYWPEMYTNQSLIDAEHPGPYTDSPAPKVFGNVSPFDPQLFSRINDYADELLAGERSAKYSPIEVARWLEQYALTAAKHLSQAALQTEAKNTPEFRRLSVDVAIQAGLGRFFAAKFRSGVLFRLYEKTGDQSALTASLEAYRSAREAWAQLAERARGVYLPDVTVGEHRQLRGHWLDRLPAMDSDIAALAKLQHSKADKADDRVAAAIRQVQNPHQRSTEGFRHTAPPAFRPGQALEIELSLNRKPATVRLFYRHVNQAERFQSVALEARDNRYRAIIPSTYTDSPYPLQYYFEGLNPDQSAWLFPGLGPELTEQPYFVVRRATSQTQAAELR